MSNAKPSKLARRHWKYTLLAYATVIALLVAAILRPSQILIWTTGVVIIIMIFTTRYHTRQGRVPKDTILEYVLVLIATLVVLFGALHR